MASDTHTIDRSINGCTSNCLGISRCVVCSKDLLVSRRFKDTCSTECHAALVRIANRELL